MNELRLPLGKIKYYDSIEDMPIERFMRFSLYTMIDASIGSDMASVDRHYSTLYKLIESNQREKVLVEIDNLRNNLYFVLENISTKGLAYGCLIHSIRGKEVKDTTKDSLLKVTKKLSRMGMRQKHLSRIVAEVKKN